MKHTNDKQQTCQQQSQDALTLEQIKIQETTIPEKNGGTYCMPFAEIKQFFDDRKESVLKSIMNGENFIPQVVAFKNAIQSDAKLSLSFERAVSKIPEGGVLFQSSPEQIYRMISITCTEPPKYKNVHFVGLPFATLFIDLMNSRQGQQFLTAETVTNHLRDIFNAYKRMLDSPKSLQYLNCEQPNGWFCPTASKNVNWDHFQIDRDHPHLGFKSFNDFFSRQVRPEMRPIDNRPNSIVHSSDSSPLYFGKGGNPVRNVKSQDNFWLKDNNYSLYDMFGARQMDLISLIDEHFVGGSVYQAHLYTWCYHRWHSPISGTIVKCYKIGNQYFMINPNLKLGGKHQGIQNYVKSMPLLSMVSIRQIIIIRIDDGSGRLMAVIEIGMNEVSSCHPTVEEGQHVNKGDQLGYFQYGGSSYAMVFDKKFDLQFNPNIYQVNENDEVPIKYVNSHLATFK